MKAAFIVRYMRGGLCAVSFLALAVYFGCGGSSGGDAGRSASSASISVVKSIGQAVGDDSMAGCQENQLKEEAIRISKEVAIFQCYIDASGLEIPDGSKTHYSLTVPEDEGKSGAAGQAMKMQLRIGKNVSQSNSLEFEVCEGGKQVDAFFFSSDAATRAITFDVKQHWTFDGSFESSQDVSKEEGIEHVDDGDGEISDKERADARQMGIIDEWMHLSGTVVAESTASGNLDKLEEIDSATVQAKFDGGFGVGSLTFAYDDDGGPDGKAANTVSGGFQSSFGEGDSGTGFIYGEFNSAEGSAKYSATGSFPGIPSQHLQGIAGVDLTKTYCPINDCEPFSSQACFVENPALSCFCLEQSASDGCTFSDSGTEHFTVVLGSDGLPQDKIANSSIFSERSAAATLPTSVSAIEKGFGSHAWDCSIPSGSTEVAVDLTKIDFSKCVALEQAVWGEEGSKDHDSCFQDQGENKEGAEELTGTSKNPRFGFAFTHTMVRCRV
ncbi:MAG: hypothetical protein HYV03_02780 [Deltaproteobacteria bacterium]|nr:hypothetical protein [Deltaproteobacteria bacterium]